YDYYPFGMLMPQRYVEDNTQQCTPQTVTHFVKVDVLEDYIVAPPRWDALILNEEVVTGEPTYEEPVGEAPGYLLVSLRTGLDIPDGEGLAFASIELTGVPANGEFRIEASVLSEEQVPLLLEVQQQVEGVFVSLGNFEVPYAAAAVIEGTAINDNPLRL